MKMEKREDSSLTNKNDNENIKEEYLGDPRYLRIVTGTLSIKDIHVNP